MLTGAGRLETQGRGRESPGASLSLELLQEVVGRAALGTRDPHLNGAYLKFPESMRKIGVESFTLF